MASKLTAPQHKALTRAASHSGLVNDFLDNITTLRHLEKQGLLEMIAYRNYAITEAGCAAIGKSEDWLLIHVMVCQAKLNHHPLRSNVCQIDWYINRWHPEPTLEPPYIGDVKFEEARIARYMELAIELTRAEMRAGLV